MVASVQFGRKLQTFIASCQHRFASEKAAYWAPSRDEAGVVPRESLPMRTLERYAFLRPFNFPAYTSGHSTFSNAASTVLSYLFPSQATYFDEQAKEASISRLYGAIHYRSDIEAGSDHGNRIGQYTVNFAMTDGADN